MVQCGLIHGVSFDILVEIGEFNKNIIIIMHCKSICGSQVREMMFPEICLKKSLMKNLLESSSV